MAWHQSLTPEIREETIQRILSTLESHVSVEGLPEDTLLRFSKNFEQHCFETAKDLIEYDRKVTSEIESMENHIQQCEEQPFQARKYVGFLGSIKMSYSSRTVTVPAPQGRRAQDYDPDAVTMERSALNVLRRKGIFKDRVSTILEKTKLLRAVSGGSGPGKQTGSVAQPHNAVKKLPSATAIASAASILLAKKRSGKLEADHGVSPQQTTRTVN